MDNKLTDIIGKEVFKQPLKIKKYRPLLSKGKNDIWSMDLVEMKPNNGYKFILSCIDLYTRYGWMVPMKDKSGRSTASAIQSIINKSGTKPEHIYCDQGKEFYNQEVYNLIGGQDKLYSTYSKNKASIVERFNRTIKTFMEKKLFINQNNEWYNNLDELVNKYNNAKHRSLKGLTPSSLYNNNENIVLNKPIEYKLEEPSTFKVGDRVRISKVKTIFEKGYTPKWTYELFTIYKIINSNPIAYKLKEEDGNIIKGSFYKEELQKTNQPEGEYLAEKTTKISSGPNKGKVKVKWLGYDDKYDTIENDSNILHHYDIKKKK